ncbi:MAG: methyltransferase domain-containing protein [Anaerolineales bacterium]|nr:methyltransferase domain-containing protein [Anaerolineales bacterium]
MDEQNLIIETFEELSPRYEQVVDTELSLFWGWRYQDFVETLLRETPITPNDRILDIATGTGMIPRAISLNGCPDKPLHGLDITFGMLNRARKKFSQVNPDASFQLTCASAMEMPYAASTFNLAICGLATHHMHVPSLLSEMYRILEPEGRVAVADVGSSPLWRIPGVKLLLRIGALIFFLIRENWERAWAEALAVSNIRTGEEWAALLAEAGFTMISIQRLQSKHRWIPDPLIMHAQKPGSEK